MTGPPRHPAAPEVFRERFASTDVAEVEEFLSASYSDITLRVTGDPRRFGCRHDTVGTSRFSVARMRTSAAFRGQLAELDGLLLVNHARAGRFTWTSDRFGAVPVHRGDLALAPPTDTFAADAHEVDVDVITLGRTEVAEYAWHMTGLPVDDLTITGLRPVVAPLAAFWNTTVAHVRDGVLGNPDLHDNQIILDSAFRTLAAALLTTFPNTVGTAVTDPAWGDRGGETSPARLREVVDYLGAHAGRPVGPADIATIAGVPTREVVRGLRRRHDTSPARLLWDHRLRGARRDLLDADPAAGATVESLAARWGFARPDRFRTSYARAFGESPEDALRR